MNTLIKDVHILTMDDADTRYDGGCIAIADGRLAYVGSPEKLPGDFRAERTIDGRGKIALPGFINAHNHLAMTLLRGYGGDLNLQDWLFTKIFPAEDRLTANKCYQGNRLGIAEMLLGGTTSFLDMYFFMDEAVRAAEEMGIRAVLSRGMSAGDNFHNALNESKALCRAVEGHERLSAMMGPHAEYTNNADTIKEVLEAAAQCSCGIHIHVSETQSEVDGCFGRYGVSPVVWMNNLGVFDFHTVAAHCVAVDDADMEILAAKGVHVAHNPGSNAKLASGIAPVQQMLDRGINVALGTDGASSNDNLDMLEEVRLAALLGKLRHNDPTAVKAQTALRMATINGARALGIENRCGSLEAGKDADLVLWDTSKPWWSPDHGKDGQLVYAASQGDVSMTMVHGNVLVENGQLLGVDIDQLRAYVQEAAMSLHD